MTIQRHPSYTLKIITLLLISLFFLYLNVTAQDIEESTIEPPDELYPIQSIAWSPDGNLLAIGVGSYIAEVHDYSVQILDVSTLEIVNRLEFHSGGVGSVDWSPDGSKLVSSDRYDGLSVVWNIQTGQRIAIIQQGTLGTFADMWSPDDSQIANISEGNQNVKIWNPNTG